MTITQTVASKLFVGFVAIAMALTLVAPAQAQTEEEMQAQIDQLMETINALQSQLGQSSDDGGDTMSGGSSASVCPYTWTRSLNTGSTGSDVMALQQFLNGDAATAVAATGVGSAGQETDYYGGLTAAAVSNFQVMYRDDILTPVGLVNPTGYFGPSTMAKANMLCASAPSMGDGDGDGDGDMMDDDKDSSDLSGEGSLDTSETDLDDEETDVGEGAEDEVIASVTFAAEDGDILASRLSFTVEEEGADNDENDPWDVFDEFSLWVDGDKVAEFDASDEDEYSDDDGPIFSFRFTGIDTVIEEDEEVDFLLAVSVANSVDGSDTAGAADWTFELDELRIFDADDVATDEDVSGTGDVTIDIEEEGTDDEADLESSSSDPDATTLLVDDGTSESDEFTVFIFDIEVSDDSSDLILTDAFLVATMTNPTGGVTTSMDDVIADIYMTIDGNTEKGESTQNLGTDDADETDEGEVEHSVAATESVAVEWLFEFDDVELESDTDYEVEIAVVFEGNDSGTEFSNGVTFEFTADGQGYGTAWEVEGLNDDNILDGSATSETHTVADVVPLITDVSSEANVDDPNDSGTISFEFNIEADGENDITLDVADNSNVDGTSDDIRFTINGTDTAIATTSLQLVSGDATYGGGTWTIQDGDDATFALDTSFATVNSGDDGTYRITLDTIDGTEVDETSDGLNLSN